ncbi:hypothetical protein [Dictyobacter arantiisoli]|uniref:Lipoprotein LpqB beta-propeller domain-containing protein n=1 Tax=Dictyobacter arantiisoli TaxID=2014874 RepID=A0A5A5TJF2_9CHLR|nr:hypothetical protein [Dictyobacter arantiisoli]GCF11143.1 hypothetical protein KDI_47070 [Dictyobacter arantiisoli]
MKQHVSSPPEHEPEVRLKRSLRPQLISKGGVIVFLVLICLLLAVTARQLLRTGSAAKPVAAHSSIPVAPLQNPDGSAVSAMHLPGGHRVLYQTQGHIYTVTTDGGAPHILNTPGYIYNRAVPVVVTTNKELLYSGNGIWSMSLPDGQARQIATFPSADQVITSLTVSQDGSTLAWSSAPQNGKGTIHLYAGNLEHTTQIYQQSATQCPCYRAFSFLNGSSTHLLLTNDRGDHRSVHFGLWSIDLSQGTAARPQQLLNDEKQQGPLALAPQANTLLYSSFLGYVPLQATNAPDDISGLSYANSLSLASIDGEQRLSKAQVILPEQPDLANTAVYHWVDTPQFAPDSQTLAYVGFSVASQKNFPRQFALYTNALHGPTQGDPKLLVTSTANYLELGSWLDASTVTFYADNALYALDVQQDTVAPLAATGTYAHVIAVIE